MKTNFPIEKLIDIMEDMMKDVEQILESPTIEKKSAIKWRDNARKKISKVFGDNHPYVKEFGEIDFTTPFIDGSDKVMFEDTYRLGLEDGKSYLIAMMDELESEYYNVFGMMDIEMAFYEIGKYITGQIEEESIRDDMLERLNILSEGLMSGEISGHEITEQIKYISKVDSGLFKRIVPVFAWYYISADDKNKSLIN